MNPAQRHSLTSVASRGSAVRRAQNDLHPRFDSRLGRAAEARLATEPLAPRATGGFSEDVVAGGIGLGRLEGRAIRVSDCGRSGDLARYLGLGLGAVLLSATGCVLLGPSIPSRVYTPDLVGPIEALTPAPNSASDVVVRGRTIRVSPNWPRELRGGLAVDALFIYGEEEGGDAWYLTLSRVDTGELTGCFGLSPREVFDDGTNLIFPITNHEGIRLPKAPGLELPAPDPETGIYPFPDTTYCIENNGAVSDANLPGGL